MLDVNLSRGERYRSLGVLDTSMDFKASLQGVPLSSSAWHPPFVHSSWPRGREIHFERLCSSLAFVSEALQRFRSTMVNLVPEHTYNNSSSRRPARTSNTSGPVPDGTTFSWLVMPFHPALYRQGMSGIASRLSYGIVDPAGSLQRIRIAWSRGFPNLEQQVSKFFKKTFTSCATGTVGPGGPVVFCSKT